MQEYWYKQSSDKPLFPDMLWSRPENRSFAGKLLIVGGSAHGFAAPAEAYEAAEKAGIGVARVLLPDSLHKTVGKIFSGNNFMTGFAPEFAPSTPSGSFSQRTLGELLPLAAWSNGVLLTDDMGRNSETAILLEKFVGTYDGQLTVSGDAADYLIAVRQAEAALMRQNTLLALSFNQAQKLFVSARVTSALAFDMDIIRMIEALHTFTTQHQAYLLIHHNSTIFLAVNGKISTSKMISSGNQSNNRNGNQLQNKMAAGAAVWWLQNPDKPFEAITTSLCCQYAA